MGLKNQTKRQRPLCNQSRVGTVSQKGSQRSGTLGFVKEFKEFAMKGNVIDLALFFLLKVINHLKREEVEQAAPPAPNRQEVLLGEIRDVLAQRLKA